MPRKARILYYFIGDLPLRLRPSQTLRADRFLGAAQNRLPGGRSLDRDTSDYHPLNWPIPPFIALFPERLIKVFFSFETYSKK